MRITNAAIYAELRSLSGQVSGLVATLPLQFNQNTEDIMSLKAQIADHETRIRVLDASRWKMIGVYSFITLVLAGVPALYYALH